MATDLMQTGSGDTAAALVARVVLKGDLGGLSDLDRVGYYRDVCRSLGLNPLTKPFEYLRLNDKLRLYATKDCTDQLRALHGVSIVRLERELVEGDVWVVTAYARMGEREDSSIGAVSVAGLKGDVRANAYMKAETKAKRRVTLSICGLGMMDEVEVETVAGAKAVTVDMTTGEVLEPPAAPATTEGEQIVERLKRGFEKLAMTPDEQRLFWERHAPGTAFLEPTVDPAALNDTLTALLLKHAKGAR